MKKHPSRKKPLRAASVDFTGAVRGKHYKRYRAAAIAVRLDPDVAQSFPDSESANEGLRELLRIRRGDAAEP